jgi:hypothetical protein
VTTATYGVHAGYLLLMLVPLTLGALVVAVVENPLISASIGFAVGMASCPLLLLGMGVVA